jgi:hypothetical protein
MMHHLCSECTVQNSVSLVFVFACPPHLNLIFNHRPASLFPITADLMAARETQIQRLWKRGLGGFAALA